MVAPRRSLPDAVGIRLTVAELVALREQVPARMKHRPLTRRAGAVPARTPGAGMDLREIRAYVAGDDLRRIDPAATARTGQPHIRQLHEDRDDTILLIADFRALMLWGTGGALRSVRAARHLALTGWQTSARGGAVGLLIATGTHPVELPSGGGDQKMLDICAALAAQHAQALTQPGTPSLAETLARALRQSPSGGRVRIATSPEGWQGAEPALAMLARRREVTIDLIMDEAELHPPSGLFAISDGQHSRVARLSPPELAADLARLRAYGAQVIEVRP